MGNVYNGSHTVVGSVSASGYVYDNLSSYAGSVSSGGDVYNSSHSKVGRVSSVGDVYDSSHSKVARVDRAGQVWGTSGGMVGNTVFGPETPSEAIIRAGGAAYLLLVYNRPTQYSPNPFLGGIGGSNSSTPRIVEEHRRRTNQQPRVRPKPHKKRPPASTLILVGVLLGGLVILTAYLVTAPIPDLTGKDLGEAAEEAADAGFELRVDSGPRGHAQSPAPWGTVVAQDPEPFEPSVLSRYPAIQPISITISAGESTVLVPEVKGLTKSEACKTLMQAGLDSEQCTWRVSGSGDLVLHIDNPDPMVKGTNPSAGTEIWSGNIVEVTTQ